MTKTQIKKRLETILNYIQDVYDEVEEAKDVNYVINLEDEITDFFREKLIAAFNTNEE